ncbi:uncharacterized protein N7459_002847 [Penicillium hispanicum]|uniref:uncharacterized protein n=1 Tax=Penicillium hispanicum TaxID=1080232 RepID=UPI00253FC34A|nr:uncharacterized protein N7459_002847 [Penicillium hispanicum]KAJ5587082.1 hypothetical protein N7459_002847 [Penicillium hispanicum]
MARTKITKSESPRKAAPGKSAELLKAEESLLFLWVCCQTNPGKELNPDYKEVAKMFGISYNATVKRYNKLKSHLMESTNQLMDSATKKGQGDTEDGPSKDTKGDFMQGTDGMEGNDV